MWYDQGFKHNLTGYFEILHTAASKSYNHKQQHSLLIVEQKIIIKKEAARGSLFAI
jgi:hypothetical protein